MPTIVLGVLGSFYYSANILPVSPPKRIFSKIKKSHQCTDSGSSTNPKQDELKKSTPRHFSSE